MKTILLGIFFLLTPIFCVFSIDWENIGHNEKSGVEELFKRLFLFEEFAFTLFGDKPITICPSLSEPKEKKQLSFTDFVDYCTYGTLPRKRIHPSWITMQKIFNNHCKRSYFFVMDPLLGITLINRQALKKILKTHHDFFVHVLGKHFSIAEFLLRIENNEESIFCLVDCHHALLGLLLGYGKTNSMLFQERAEREGWFVPKIPFQTKRYLSQHCDAKERHSVLFHPELQYFPLVVQNRPNFSVDPLARETILLRKKYVKMEKKVQSILHSEDWLEQIVHALAQPTVESDSVYHSSFSPS